MAWLSITLELDPAQAETLSEALLEAGAESVSLESTSNDPATLEPGARMRVVALASAAPIPPRSLPPPPRPQRSRRPRSPWRASRKRTGCGARRRSSARFASPSACGSCRAGIRRPTRRRSWCGSIRDSHSAPAATSARAWSCSISNATCAAGERVLDYGCGSGILAIVAGKLGAGEIAAIDIDPQALETTAANASRQWRRPERGGAGIPSPRNLRLGPGQHPRRPAHRPGAAARRAHARRRAHRALRHPRIAGGRSRRRLCAGFRRRRHRDRGGLGAGGRRRGE